MTLAKVCGYYVKSQIAKKDAITCGFDEALLLDAEGYVSEGSGENIKVTRPEDMIIGDAILASRNKKQIG